MPRRTERHVSTGLTELQKAWLAGFLDGEGHFGVQETAVRKNGHRYYVPILQVAQAGYSGIALIHAIYQELGGVGTLHNGETLPPAIRMHATKGHRFKYQIQWYGPMVVEICQMLIPYLRLKKPQAELLAAWPARQIISKG